MKIEMKRLNDAMHFEASNEEGNTILMDGSKSIGGEGKGVRPMQVMLMALAGCSSIDVVLILKKMRQQLQDIKVTVETESIKIQDHSKFGKINLHFQLWGDLKEEKVRNAIEMSIDTYCSVGKIIEKSSEIGYTLEIHDSK